MDNDTPGKELAKKINTKFSNPHFKIRYIHYSNENNFELEDILPVDIIEKSFEFALNELEITANYQIKFSKEKPVAFWIDEFKGKHKFTNEQSNLFESNFKTSIDILVEKDLEGILLLKSTNAKQTAFQERFGEYCIFIESFIEKFFKNLRKQLVSEIDEAKIK